MFKPKLGHKIEVHLCKSYSASRLNRDGSDRPKTVNFGGVRRLRISSQAEKSSIRNSDLFTDFLRESHQKFGAVKMIRTQKVADDIRTALLEILESKNTKTERYTSQIDTALMSLPLLFKDNDTPNEDLTTQLVSFSEAEIEFIAQSMFQKNDKNEIIIKDCKTSLQEFAKTRQSVGPLSPELQLFGRFSTASVYLKDIHTPLQVNQAFTVHSAEIEHDYWTASDDLNSFSEENPGSAHIGHRAFGAGVFYFYYCLDVPLLCRNINAAFTTLTEPQKVLLIQNLISAFLYSTLTRNPKGGQSSHANNNLPLFSYITYGSAFPYSADSAFEVPVQPAVNGGYSDVARIRFIDWIQDRKKRYGNFCGFECGMGIDDKDLDSNFQVMIERTVEQATETIHKEIINS